MKNILVLTDFSHNAYNALFNVCQWYKGEPCTFHILNVYNLFSEVEGTVKKGTLEQQLKAFSIEGLERTLHRIKLDRPDPEHGFKIISERGDLVSIVSRLADYVAMDLIVMGNSGSSEIEAIFMGNNAVNLIGGAKSCPILAIPKEIEFKPPKKIAFVTDYAKCYDAGLLKPFLELAKKYGSKILVMHINQEQELDRIRETNRRILMEYLAPLDYSMHWMPHYRTKAGTINLFLEELEIDVLVMVNHQHSIIERLTREPVIKRVAYNLDIPFLILPCTD